MWFDRYVRHFTIKFHSQWATFIKMFNLYSSQINLTSQSKFYWLHSKTNAMYLRIGETEKIPYICLSSPQYPVWQNYHMNFNPYQLVVNQTSKQHTVFSLVSLLCTHLLFRTQALWELSARIEYCIIFTWKYSVPHLIGLSYGLPLLLWLSTERCLLWLQ